jgi:putative restriction endonuclease
MGPTLPESRYGRLWSREESVLAFELYCRIPFQKTKANNPAVRHLAGMLGRTPASVARKLGNFGAFDPALQKLNITGLTHTSELDREIWDEFHANWNDLVWKADLLRKNFGDLPAIDDTPRVPTGPSEVMRITKERVHQAFFRDAVLTSYDSTCCITGLAERECLVASHIVPWSESETFRADPTNGLCLSATFDRLFDCGLMTVSAEMKVRFSSRILNSSNSATRELLSCYNNQLLKLPHRFVPRQERLEWHRETRFRG